MLDNTVWSKVKPPEATLNQWSEKPLVGVSGEQLQIQGIAEVSIQLANKCFQISLVVVNGLTTDAIIGLDFLEAHNCTLTIGDRLLHIPSCKSPIPVCGSTHSSTPTQVYAILAACESVPAYSEKEVMVSIPQYCKDKSHVLEAMETKVTIMAARTLVHPTTNTIPVRLLNLSGEAVTLYEGTKIATIEEVDDSVALISSVSTSNQSNCSSDLQTALWNIVSRSDTELDETQEQALYNLLLQYSGIFAIDEHDFGHAKTIKHQINTGSSTPIRQQTRRVPRAHRQEAKHLVESMLNNKIITPSSSPWASPVVLVRKKDGSLRFCVDYRKINAITRKDAYPLPRVDDTLDALACCKWFTTLDLLSGYWQVEVDEKDREKTAFATPDGLFEFTRMPFGLCNAPATFQRLMDLVLGGLQWNNCLVYLDDILIIGKTFDDHLHNLSLVLDRLRGAGLKLKPSKCDVCKKQVTYLGHIVSTDGVATDPAKTDRVKHWPNPTCKRQIQQFLGLASYYRRFINGFATIAKPLHHLTEKTTIFKWTTQCQEAFDHLKQCLISAPILAFPNYNKPFLLDTDASEVGIGAVLSQQDDSGRERVIAYASRTLSKPERKYCVTRKELLSVVTFIRHFRPFLLGQKFTLRTDHGSLIWLSKFKQPEGQLARWIEKLQEYNFDIIHRPGNRHSNADSLSRLPCNQCGREDGHITDVAFIAAVSETFALQQFSPQKFRESQLDDQSVGFVLRSFESHEKPEPNAEVRKLIQLWDQLKLHNGLLYRNYESTDGNGHLQLVVPAIHRNDILQALHAGIAGGHLGQDKTLSRLKERFYWPGHWNDVNHWCRTCATCASRKTPSPKQKAHLQPVKTGYPMQIVATDILGPLPLTPNGNSYLLVASDYFTRWVEAYPIPNQEAVTIAQKLTSELFFRFSLPDQLHSDQGRQFESVLIAEICKLLQIHKSRTTAYHPQGDGLVERFNRTLLDMLATTIKDYPGSWEDHVRAVCMAYNTSVQPTTGFTPFYLMFGRQARIPVDIMYGSPVVETSPSAHASMLKKSLTTAYDLVRVKMDAQFKRQKQFYDKKVHGAPYKIGDLVWLYSLAVPPGHSKKLHHPWYGPFEIIKCLSDATYRIADVQASHHTQVVHFDRLKLCPPDIRLTCREQSSQSPTEQSVLPNSSMLFGTCLQLIDDDTPSDLPRRYPQRLHRAPVRYTDTDF